MSQRLCLTDSEVAAITLSGNKLHIGLSAAHVLQSESGVAGKPTEGFSQGVKILLIGVPTNDQLPDSFIGRISNGRLQMGNQWLTNISLPCSITAPIRLELTFANQSCLEITATGLECRFEGEANFSESLFC